MDPSGSPSSARLPAVEEVWPKAARWQQGGVEQVEEEDQAGQVEQEEEADQADQVDQEEQSKQVEQVGEVDQTEKEEQANNGHQAEYLTSISVMIEIK